MYAQADHYHAYIDGHRRPPSPPVLSRRDRLRRVHRDREAAFRHADADARADLLVAIDEQVDARSLFRADAHKAARLAPGTLDDGSLTTAQLRAALDVLRGLPTP